MKAAFDPDNILNPGKVVEGPSPTENLRLGAGYQRLPVVTTFDFSRDGSLAQAAELCNGAGVCRKTLTGTMCPSFMVTGSEEHSTRGRANALRLALSGALPAEEFTGPRLFATYDLCLQCKGCKAECPSNVDVAKLKMEFLDHYYRRHAPPLGVRLMARAGRLNRIGAALAPFSNWAGHLPGAGWIAEKLLGIDHRRPLPTFARQHFRRWFDDRESPPAGAAPRGQIVLLDDCLTSYCEPRVNQSAVAVLEAAGYEVHLAGLECCGRTFASKGFLGAARQLAVENIARLMPWARRGVPIVGCEPSCLLMLVDEYPELVPGDDARLVAEHAALVDSHLARKGLVLPLRPLAKRSLAAWPLSSEGAGRAGRHAGGPGPNFRAYGRAGRFGLLRHGRLVWLRALRLEHEDRGADIVSGCAKCRRRDGRGAGIFLPAADRARHGATGPAPFGVAGGTIASRDARVAPVVNLDATSEGSTRWQRNHG